MWDNGSSAALIMHSFTKRAGLQGEKVEFQLVVVGLETVLRQMTLYTFKMIDNSGQKHMFKAFGIEQITDDTRLVDLNWVKTAGAPQKVFTRPTGPIDILVESMFKNIEPYGSEAEFTRGRLRLVKSMQQGNSVIEDT